MILNRISSTLANIVVNINTTMQFSTENQAIVFESEGSEGQNQPSQEQGNQEYLNELNYPEGELYGSEEGSKKEQQDVKETLDAKQTFDAYADVSQKEKPGKLPLFQLDLEEDQHTQQHQEELPFQYRNRKIAHKEGEEPVKTQTKKFNDILPEDEVEKNHKIIQKNEDKYESKHIMEGLFHRSEENDHEEIVPVEETNISPNQIESTRNSQNFAKKLPPLALSPKKEDKIDEQPRNNENLMQQESSYACLDKLQSDIKGKVQVEDHNLQIQGQHSAMSSTSPLPFKKIPRGRKLKFTFIRQKKCPYNCYHPEYTLKKPDDSIVFAAKKQWGHLNSHYNISMEQRNYSKTSSQYLGFLKGNFTGTYFNLFKYQDTKKELVATIYYKPEFGCCSSSFRVIQVYIKNDHYSYEQLQGTQNGEDINLKELFEVGQNRDLQKIVKIVNKTPQWNQKRKAYVLNFRKKSKIPSVKNMILIDENNGDRQSLLFCKTDSNQFYLQVASPLTNFTAFGILLTAFDFKLACE